MGKLQGGAARADITPPIGTPLAGFWSPRAAEGIDTPLMAHALVLNDGDTRLAVVGLDLIALLAEQADEAKAAIEERTGIPPENVLIACSHTHEAPYPCPLLGGDNAVDPTYLATVVDGIVDAVAHAAGTLRPAEAGFAAAPVSGLCQNRRRLKSPGDVYNCWMLRGEERESPPPPAGPVDEDVTLLAVRTTAGDPLAVLWNYSLHAHAFAAPRVSADYPYHVWQRLADELGDNLTCVFTAGACGDINRPGSCAPQTIVDSLSATLLQLYGDITFTRDLPLDARVEKMTVPLRDHSQFQEEEIRRKLPGALEVCRKEWEIMRAEGTTEIATVVHAMRMGDFALAGVPGEYFVALGLDIKQRSPFPCTAVVELANDYVGYIPAAAAFDEGGYELFTVRSSKVGRGVGERMADRLVEMLAQMR